MLLATPALFWDPPGFGWIKLLKEQNSQKQILISKTKIDVLVTNWTRISPTYPIHNRSLLCVSSWVDSHSKDFLLLYLLLHSVQFSCSVISNWLWPHGLQHTRLSCPSPIPRACWNSCPLSRWCHPIISSSVVPLSSHLQSFPASGSFPTSQFFASGDQSIGVSALASVLHSSCFLGHGPLFTVISLDEFIIHFPSHSKTSPYLSWKHYSYWSPFTPWHHK